MNSVSKKIRVMIVDDSAVIRSIIEKILKTDPSVEICGYASNGEQAVQSVTVCNPDIILLDIEMPVMDGVTAIPLILGKKKDVRIIMCSTLSARGAEISMKAMNLGAADCVLKPSGSGNIQSSQDFHTILLRMVREMGKTIVEAAKPVTAPTNYKTQNRPVVSPKVIAIGSSTGGPNALEVVLKSLKGVTLPIVITQHIPPTFAKIMATHLTKSTGIECVEAENGMVLESGKAYIAPSGSHMNFTKSGVDVRVALDDGPEENFCKPAVDSMLRSLVATYRNRVLMVMLTGMGEDGLKGTRELASAGGFIIAQDKESSVVWGMPGAIAQAGLCNNILPLNEIGTNVASLCRGAQM